jgi:hypothetical protein
VEVDRKLSCTSEKYLAALCQFAYGVESLVRVTVNNRKPKFEFAVPTKEFRELRDQLYGDIPLAISDLRTYNDILSELSRQVRDMIYKNQTEWTREEFTVSAEPEQRPESFWTNARAASELRRLERERREQHEKLQQRPLSGRERRGRR